MKTITELKVKRLKEEIGATKEEIEIIDSIMGDFNSQQPEELTCQGEGEFMESIASERKINSLHLGTGKPNEYPSADVKKFYSWIILTNEIPYYLNFADKEVNSDEINMCIDEQYFGDLK